MPALAEQLLERVYENPGATDRYLTDLLFSKVKHPSTVNQEANLLSRRGKLLRKRRNDGRWGNYPPETVASVNEQAVSFDTIWARIKAHEGQKFRQIRGGEFTYGVTRSAVVPDRTNQNIPRVHFEEAVALLPLRNTVPVRYLRGPSYIYALLMDQRIRKADW